MLHEHVNVMPLEESVRRVCHACSGGSVGIGADGHLSCAGKLLPNGDRRKLDCILPKALRAVKSLERGIEEFPPEWVLANGAVEGELPPAPAEEAAETPAPVVEPPIETAAHVEPTVETPLPPSA